MAVITLAVAAEPPRSPTASQAGRRSDVTAGSATTPSRMLDEVIPSWQPVR